MLINEQYLKHLVEFVEPSTDSNLRELEKKRVQRHRTTYTYIDSPLGKILLACNREGLTTISFQKGIQR